MDRDNTESVKNTIANADALILHYVEELASFQRLSSDELIKDLNQLLQKLYRAQEFMNRLSPGFYHITKHGSGLALEQVEPPDVIEALENIQSLVEHYELQLKRPPMESGLYDKLSGLLDELSEQAQLNSKPQSEAEEDNKAI